MRVGRTARSHRAGNRPLRPHGSALARPGRAGGRPGPQAEIGEPIPVPGRVELAELPDVRVIRRPRVIGHPGSEQQQPADANRVGERQSYRRAGPSAVRDQRHPIRAAVIQDRDQIVELAEGRRRSRRLPEPARVVPDDAVARGQPLQDGPPDGRVAPARMKENQRRASTARIVGPEMPAVNRHTQLHSGMLP